MADSALENTLLKYPEETRGAFYRMAEDYGYTFTCFVKNPQNLEAIAENLHGKMFLQRGLLQPGINGEYYAAEVKRLNNGKSINVWHCSDPFWNAYTPTEKFIAGFSALPFWYRRVIEQINDRSEHVKIEILSERPIFLVSGYDGYEMYYNSPKTTRIIHPAISAVLSVSFRDGIFRHKKLTTLLFHHIFRLLTYSWNFHPISDSQDEISDAVQKVCQINNDTPRKYFALSSNKITPEDIYTAFDADVMNLIGDHILSPGKQTSIFTYIDLFKKFKNVDGIRANLEKEKYLFYQPDGDGYVEILKPLPNGNGLSVNCEQTYSGIFWEMDYDYADPLRIQSYFKNTMTFSKKVHVSLLYTKTFDQIKEKYKDLPKLISAIQTLLDKIDPPVVAEVKKPVVKKTIKRKSTKSLVK